MEKNILLIEDEPGIADNVVYALQSENFVVTWVMMPLITSKSINAWLIMISIFRASLRETTSFGFN